MSMIIPLNERSPYVSTSWKIDKVIDDSHKTWKKYQFQEKRTSVESESRI